MSHASSSPTETTGVKPRRRFLVIDDNRDFVESLRVLLELNGHHVEVAFDGVAGLEAARRLQPDVVVLDVGLPKLNGYEVCRCIREQRLAMQPLIIAATGWSQLVDPELGKYVGFDAQLVKPFGYDELSVVLESGPARP